jgi:hypothetical protein
MANPTTNYGFVLPTSSDLVTDLPADFDVALQGVDTRLKALQPGTTLGDLAYSSATANTNTRLGIGSTGQVLKVVGGVPAWSSATVGSLTLISAVSFSASSSIDLSNVFSATYDNYQIICTFTASNNGDLQYRYRVGGADDSTTNYNFQVMDVSDTSITGFRLTGQTLSRLVGTPIGARSSFTSTFFNPYLSATKHTITQGINKTSSGMVVQNIAGSFDASTSFTGLTLIPQVGTITGTVRVYGLSNS